jgi:hypothetical protein
MATVMYDEHHGVRRWCWNLYGLFVILGSIDVVAAGSLSIWIYRHEYTFSSVASAETSLWVTVAAGIVGLMLFVGLATVMTMLGTIFDRQDAVTSAPVPARRISARPLPAAAPPLVIPRPRAPVPSVAFSREVPQVAATPLLVIPRGPWPDLAILRSRDEPLGDLVLVAARVRERLHHVRTWPLVRRVVDRPAASVASATSDLPLQAGM